MSKDSTKSIEVPLSHRLLWRAGDVAVMLGLSRSAWLALNRAELCPAPVKVAYLAVRVWRAAEIRDWVNGGCLQRSLWSWKPATPGAYDKLIAQKKRELESIQDELAATAE